MSDNTWIGIAIGLTLTLMIFAAVVTARPARQQGRRTKSRQPEIIHLARAGQLIGRKMNESFTKMGAPFVVDVFFDRDDGCFVAQTGASQKSARWPVDDKFCQEVLGGYEIRDAPGFMVA